MLFSVQRENMFFFSLLHSSSQLAFIPRLPCRKDNSREMGHEVRISSITRWIVIDLYWTVFFMLPFHTTCLTDVESYRLRVLCVHIKNETNHSMDPNLRAAISQRPSFPICRDRNLITIKFHEWPLSCDGKDCLKDVFR